MRRLTLITTALFGLHGIWYSAVAQTDQPSDHLRKLTTEIQKLIANQQAISEEVREIKELLREMKLVRQARRASTEIKEIDVVLDITDASRMGSRSAPVTIIEYTDYQCVFCARHAERVLPQVKMSFVVADKLQYVIRDFPLSNKSSSMQAHQAALCASAQGQYWEMHEQLFANQATFRAGELLRYAEAAGVADLLMFEDCMEDGRYIERIRGGVSEGSRMHLRGAPSFVLGFTQSDGTTVNGKIVIRGAQAYSVFEEAINQLLAAAGS